MSARSRRRILAVVVVWIVVIGASALLYRMLFAPAIDERAALADARAEYATLAEEARTRGVTAEPLPDDADLDAIVARTGDLQERLTGSGPLVAGAGVDHRVGLALDSFSGYWAFRSDELERELAARGLALRLVDDGADYGRRFEALESGETPLAVFTIDALLKVAAQRGRLPGTIVMVIDETVGADAMVAWEQAVPDLDALNRADGRIVVTPDSPSETLARVVMANFDLDALPADPFVRANGSSEALDRFLRADRADPRAYVLWEPYVAKALEEPGAHVLLDSSRFRGFIVDVLVVQREYLLEHEARVRDVVEAYFRTLYATADRPADLARLVREDARRAGEAISPGQAARLVDGVWWKNTRENYVHFEIVGADAAEGLPGLDRIIANVVAVLMRTGALAADPTEGAPGRLYYDRILRALFDEGFHPGTGGVGQAEKIRAAAELRPLSDEEWDALVPVGTLSVDRIVFARGTARLTRQSAFALRALTETLEAFPHYYLSVEGRARRDGDADANRRLAADRAEAVRAKLEALGVPMARVRAVSVEPRGTGGGEQSVSFVLSQRPY